MLRIGRNMHSGLLFVYNPGKVSCAHHIDNKDGSNKFFLLSVSVLKFYDDKYWI